jgi:hypothetical protein
MPWAARCEQYDLWHTAGAYWPTACAKWQAWSDPQRPRTLLPDMWEELMTHNPVYESQWHITPVFQDWSPPCPQASIKAAGLGTLMQPSLEPAALPSREWVHFSSSFILLCINKPAPAKVSSVSVRRLRTSWSLDPVIWIRWQPMPRLEFSHIHSLPSEGAKPVKSGCQDWYQECQDIISSPSAPLWDYEGFPGRTLKSSTWAYFLSLLFSHLHQRCFLL